MVSKANYVVITTMMIIVLILFQFTGISENVVLRGGENVNVDLTFSDADEAAGRLRYEEAVKGLTEFEGAANIGLVGSEESCLKIGEEWCVNQKKTYRFYDSLQEAANDPDCADILLADGSILEDADSEKAIVQLGENNRSVVFSGLPDLEKLEKSPAIMKSLGIREILDKSIRLDGFKLFAGFLLGGETVYDEYEQIIPYVKLDESVYVYAVGELDEGWFLELENEELPAVMWRSYNGKGKVYVVNSDFLEKKMGAGILTGIAADTVSYYLYPVVNAQISVVANYPILSDENREVMLAEYGQDSIAAARDIMWPVMAGIYYDTDERMTAMIAPRLDYRQNGELDENLVEYYYQQVTKMRGELGISGEQVSDIMLDEKLQQDMALMKEMLPNYEIRAFYAGDMEQKEYENLLHEGEILEDVHTVLKDYSDQSENPVFSFGEENVLEMMLYMDSTEHSNEDDFRLRCFQTAYGYYATKLDAARMVYPQSETDLWNKVSENWAKYYRPYRVIFKYFDKLTTTAADRRVRNYLALDYETVEMEDGLTLNIESQETQNYFILKTHGEKIEKITGAEYEELETDWYLIKTNDSQVEIQLEQTDQYMIRGRN